MIEYEYENIQLSNFTPSQMYVSQRCAYYLVKRYIPVCDGTTPNNSALKHLKKNGGFFLYREHYVDWGCSIYNSEGKQ